MPVSDLVILTDFSPGFAGIVTFEMLLIICRGTLITLLFREFDGLQLRADGFLEFAGLGVGCGEGIQVVGIPVEF